MKKNWNWFKELKWKLFMFKLKITFAHRNLKYKHLRRKYCRFGFHNLRSNRVQFVSNKARTRTFHYLSCSICNFKFFATPNEKKKYMEYDQRGSLLMNSSLNRLLNRS